MVDSSNIFPMHPPQLSTLLLPLLVAPVYGANSFACEKISVGGHNFDLSKLGGPHSVVTTRFEASPPEHYNTTYTLDICKPLKKSGKGSKDEQCPDGTRVCGITHLIRESTDIVSKVRAIAGDLEKAGGTKFDFTATRLKTSEAKSDSEKEGLRLEFTGGKNPLSGPEKERFEQKAVIEFLCDPEKEGTEGEWESEDKYEKRAEKEEDKEGEKKDEKKDGDKEDEKKDGDKEDEKKDGDKDEGESTIEHQLKHENASLIWDGFAREKEVDVLRLTWYTKYACEKREDNGGSGGDESSSAHWGFFTWFTVITFLCIAGYLVFSSWINFTRYGARGWDLLPHSDTIRDVPYLLKDFIRRVLNSVQGTGSRGGYSAV